MRHVYGWLNDLNLTSAAEDSTTHNLRTMAYSFIACSLVFLGDEMDVGPACPLLRLDTMNTKYFAAVTMRFSSWLSL
jgi:hypothetical protein